MAGIGSISILGWVFSGLGGLAIAIAFSRLSKLVPKTGGPYVYPKEGFGDYIGFLSGWAYWISLIVSNASVALVFSGYFVDFIPGLKDSKLVFIIVSLSAIWLLTWVNSRGVRSGGRMQLVTTILKVLPLLAVSVAALFYFNMDNLQPFNGTGESNLTAFGLSVSLTLFAFLGLESATIPAGNIKNPEVTIPRATIMGVVLVVAIYILGSIAIMGVIPRAELMVSTAPFADAASVIWGDTGRFIVGLGAIVSTFGALNGLILFQAQMPFAMAKDILLPPIFAKKSKNDVPIYGLVFSSILITVVILMNYSSGLLDIFKFLILLATFFNLISYLFSSMAETLIIIKRGDYDRAELVRSFVRSIPAFAFSILAVYWAGLETVYYGFVMLMLGSPIYIWSRIKQKEL